MLNLKHKIPTKLILLILAQIIFFISAVYPESSPNKNIPCLYIQAKYLRVPMMGSDDRGRLGALAKALNKEEKVKLTEPVLDNEGKQRLRTIIEAVYPEQIQEMISRIKIQVAGYSVEDMRAKALELLRSNEFALRDRAFLRDLLGNSCMILEPSMLEIFMNTIDRNDSESLAPLDRAILLWEVIAQLSSLYPLNFQGKGAIYRWLTEPMAAGLTDRITGCRQAMDDL